MSLTEFYEYIKGEWNCKLGAKTLYFKFDGPEMFELINNEWTITRDWSVTEFKDRIHVVDFGFIGLKNARLIEPLNKKISTFKMLNSNNDSEVYQFEKCTLNFPYCTKPKRASYTDLAELEFA